MPGNFDVQYVARLARIALTPAEEEKFGVQLSHVLGYIEKLNQLDVSGIHVVRRIARHEYKVSGTDRILARSRYAKAADPARLIFLRTDHRSVNLSSPGSNPPEIQVVTRRMHVPRTGYAIVHDLIDQYRANGMEGDILTGT